MRKAKPSRHKASDHPGPNSSRRCLAGAAAVGLAASVLAALASTAAADHLASGCYDEHDGPHVFELTDARVTIEFTDGPLAGQSDHIQLRGPTYVETSVASPTQLDAEIVKMHLMGMSSVFGPVKITENPLVASTGTVEPVGASCFPSVSTFDVFVIIDLPALGLIHNDDPVQMQAAVSAVPPAQGEAYINVTPADEIPLFLGPPHDGPPPIAEDHVANLIHAEHTPDPTPMPSPTPPPVPPTAVPAASGLGIAAALLAVSLAGMARLRLRAHRGTSTERRGFSRAKAG